MKIETLLELVDTQTKERKYHGKFRHGTGRSERKLGAGAYSTVRKNRQDPHLVTKAHHSPVVKDMDGFVDWADYMAQNKLGDNPHFPRIYNITRNVDKMDKSIYRYDMESLEKLSDQPVEQLIAIINQHFNVDKDSLEELKGASAPEYADMIAAYIETAFDGYDEILKSDTIKDAVRLLRKYYEYTEKQTGDSPISDIHGDNIMVRRGPYGIVPVITDPFA